MCGGFHAKIHPGAKSPFIAVMVSFTFLVILTVLQRLLNLGTEVAPKLSTYADYVRMQHDVVTTPEDMIPRLQLVLR